MIRKIKRFFVHILVSPILNHDTRRKVRMFLMDFPFTSIVYVPYNCLCSVFPVLKFLRHHIRKDSILLLETNDSHGEVMAGYLKYFKKLGYKIDILVENAIIKENPFCRMEIKADNINIFHCYRALWRWILGCKKILKYKHVFLMTSAYYLKKHGKIYGNVLYFFPKLKKHPSLYIVEHDLKDVERFKEKEFLTKNHLITLGHFDKGVFIAPVSFENIQKKPKNKTTAFISVGGIQSFRKNHQTLVEAIQQLASENLKFKVVVIGLGKLDHLPESIRSYIQVTGRVGFKKMFEYMEKADFFLPLLDANNPEHNRYITTGVTGSAQLIYAFSKVPILHPKFAPFYRLDNNNAILTKDLAQGMRQAIQMSADEYTLKQKALTNLATELEKESFYNLKKILNI